MLTLSAVALGAPTAAADDVRVVAYCDLKDPPYMGSDPIFQPDNGVACGASFKQADRSCKVVVAGTGYCLYTEGGVGVGGYSDQPWIPTMCPDGENCYGAEAGLWGKDVIFLCAVKVETPGGDPEPCFTLF